MELCSAFLFKKNFLDFTQILEMKSKKGHNIQFLMSEKSIDQNIFPEVLETARCFYCPRPGVCIWTKHNHKTIVWFWLWDMCPENYRMSNSPVPRENNCTKVLQLLNKATKHTECKLHTDQLMTAVVLYIPWQISDYSDWGDWILKKRGILLKYI